MEIDVPNIIIRLAVDRLNQMIQVAESIKQVHRDYIESHITNDELKQIEKDINEIKTFLKNVSAFRTRKSVLMKKYEIELPTIPTSIEFQDKNEGFVWFKKNDISIDFIIDDSEKIEPKQLWLTGNHLIELSEAPFLVGWMKDVLLINRNEILKQFNK